MSTNKKIEFLFPQVELNEYVPKGAPGSLIKRMSVNLDEIQEWFGKYHIESIELWVSGMVQTDGITKLVVSAKGEGGLKVILKPK